MYIVIVHYTIFTKYNVYLIYASSLLDSPLYHYTLKHTHIHSHGVRCTSLLGNIASGFDIKQLYNKTTHVSLIMLFIRTVNVVVIVTI